MRRRNSEMVRPTKPKMQRPMIENSRKMAVALSMFFPCASLMSPLGEQLLLALRVLDSLAGHLEVASVLFHSDELDARIDGCDPGTPAAHERVEHDTRARG